VEARLAELDALVRESLRTTAPELDRCSFHLDEISTLAIDPLMLKKHPHIVETIRKVNFKFLCSSVYTYTVHKVLNMYYVAQCTFNYTSYYSSQIII
jgi:hypothetical protein